MALSMTNFYPLSLLAPKYQNFALQIVVFFARNTVPVIIDAHCAKNFFLHNLGTGSSLSKTTSRAKIWSGLGAFKNLGPPIYFSNH